MPKGAVLCAGGLLWFAAGRPGEIPFEKHTLDPGANETCAFADVNGDGRTDIISGENWYRRRAGSNTTSTTCPLPTITPTISATCRSM